MRKLKFWFYHFRFLIQQKCLYNVTVLKYAIDNIDHMEDSISKRILSLKFIQKIINRLYLKLVKKTVVVYSKDNSKDNLNFIQKIIKKLYLKLVKKSIK